MVEFYSEETKYQLCIDLMAIPNQFLGCSRHNKFLVLIVRVCTKNFLDNVLFSFSHLCNKWSTSSPYDVQSIVSGYTIDQCRSLTLLTATPDRRARNSVASLFTANKAPLECIYVCTFKTFRGLLTDYINHEALPNV